MIQSAKLRTLLSAAMLSMAGAGLLVGGTYALFTDSVSIGNHLEAGNLNISLLRTSYSKTTLDSDGYLSTITDSTEVDFSEETEENIFALEEDEYVVPGSSFLANLKLVNGKKNGDNYVSSSVAFSYNVKIVVSEDSNSDFISQLTVTVKKGEEEVANKKLSEFGTDAILSGKMTKNDASAEFSVKVAFDDLDPEKNNKAQDKKASFDLKVEAIQLTSAD